MTGRPVLYLVVCAAPPAQRIGGLVELLMRDGWTVCVIATPTAATWVDREALAERTGHPVRWTPRSPGDPAVHPEADAVLVAPATFNTVNKWALGINDSVALGILNELLMSGLPILVSPYAKGSLTAHPSYAGHVRLLAGAGVEFTETSALRPGTEAGEHPWHLVSEPLRRHLRTGR
ncbi:bifunctional phosphopantothenoylcysteine decarboxylase/phosphopantothenate synthase [Micromonospora sp. MW-13]|uniref:flavoprotein n=1 Tax=Micromonospora sp. MW-13 TaxID=2094022 RepID=UPI000E42D81F|nr:flavoprotein [Micromonospora sp. MW-13]RGC67997.1 bifunctional phosphopantothenoylcysteine decarboxylase/phosphopantothenate synthase [Micromonospora sp. MW-13]